MELKATSEQQTISTNSLRYQITGSASERAYDFCYYEIKSGLTEEEANALKGDEESVSILIKISKAKEMNVYLWGGSKDEALIKITDDNKVAQLDETYAVDYKKGMLLVAYPNDKADTEFEFSYKIAGYTAEKEIWELVGLEKDDEMLFYIICGGIVLLLVLCFCGCICMAKRKNNGTRVEIIDEENMKNPNTHPNQGGNETSVQLEDGEHSDNLNIHSKTKDGQGVEMNNLTDQSDVQEKNVDGKRYSKVKNSKGYDTKDPFTKK